MALQKTTVKGSGACGIGSGLSGEQDWPAVDVRFAQISWAVVLIGLETPPSQLHSVWSQGSPHTSGTTASRLALLYSGAHSFARLALLLSRNNGTARPVHDGARQIALLASLLLMLQDCMCHHSAHLWSVVRMKK